MNNGWVKLHRQIIEHWIFRNPNYLRAWLIMLITVNFEDKKVLIETEVIECKRGQSLNSLYTWVKLFGKNWTIQKVRTFFDLLKNDSMINTEGMRKTTRLTICNYESYQDQQQTGNKQITDRQQAGNKQVTTTKERKELKNEKNIIPPNLEMIKNYCRERNNGIDINKFFDFYESKGWMVGKNKMKDWQATIRTWEKSESKKDKPFIVPILTGNET